WLICERVLAMFLFFFFQAEDGIRDFHVTGVQTCALPIYEIANAKSKLHKKNMDMIVLNSLLDEGSGFGTDTNKVTFITKNGAPETQPLKSKMEVAKDIVTYIANNFKL